MRIVLAALAIGLFLADPVAADPLSSSTGPGVATYLASLTAKGDLLPPGKVHAAPASDTMRSVGIGSDFAASALTNGPGFVASASTGRSVGIGSDFAASPN